jgi:hydrogenase maturation protease
LIRIIGIGSPFGDDAAGLEVARILAQEPPTDCEVIVVDRPGASLIELLDGIDAAILIDAVRSGRPSGTLHQFSFDDLERCGVHFVSSHELGVAASIQLARKLGRAPAWGRVLGIEVSPVLTRVPCPLSPGAQQAVSQTLTQARLLVRELSEPAKRRWGAQEASDC